MAGGAADRETAMNEHKATTDRLGAFSDTVIAVIITIKALELDACCALFPYLRPEAPGARL
jgi:hypothetical protein